MKGCICLRIVLLKHDLLSLLDDIKTILNTDGTDGFMFIKKRKNEKSDPKATNNYCLIALQYNDEDVMQEIISLDISHYYESVFDLNSPQTDLLHIFIKEIAQRQVYIKLKIKKIDENKKVLCISFHFAEHNISNLPYG